MKFILHPLAFFALLLPLAAQQQQQQFQNVQRQQEQQSIMDAKAKGEDKEEKAPELFPGENADVGPQLLVRAKPRRQWLEATADSQYYYTSNVFLAKESYSGSPTDTGVMVSTAQVAFAPDAFDLWDVKVSPRLGFRYQWYNYGMDKVNGQDIPKEITGLNSLDFDAQTAFAEANFNFFKDWNATIGADFTRLVGHEAPRSDYYEFYKEVAPHFRIERVFPVNNDIAISLAYTNYIRITDSTPLTPMLEGQSSYNNNRIENALTLTYTQQIIERLIAQPYFRCEYDNYMSSTGVSGSFASREDLAYGVGMSLAYYFNKWASVRSFISYDTRSSHGLTEGRAGIPSGTIYDYEVYNGGIGADLTFRF